MTDAGGGGGRRSSDTAALFNLRETLANILDESEKQFTCLICSEIFRSPVTITCGHTFCKSCIEDWFATKENCPCCRQACIEGPSEPVYVLEEYLQRAKPLIQQRMILLAAEEQKGNVERELQTTGCEQCEDLQNGKNENCGSRQDISQENRIRKDQAFAKLMTNKLNKMKTPGGKMRLEASLWISRTLISSGEPHEKLMTDLYTMNMEHLIRKYYKKREVMFGTSLNEHEYIPQVRVKDYYFVPPSTKDLLWIFGMICCTVVLYGLFSRVDSTVYEELQQSLLRILGVLSFYLSTFEELYEDIL